MFDQLADCVQLRELQHTVEHRLDLYVLSQDQFEGLVRKHRGRARGSAMTRAYAHQLLDACAPGAAIRTCRRRRSAIPAVILSARA